MKFSAEPSAPLATVVGSADDQPGAFIRAALIAQAILLAAVFVPFIVDLPTRQDAVKVELFLYPSANEPVYHVIEIDTFGRPQLDGRRRSDLVELRMGLDHIRSDADAAIELRPHPEARYEDVLETLATASRAGFDRFRIVAEGEKLPGRFAR